MAESPHTLSGRPKEIVHEWAEQLAARFGVTADAIKANPTRLIDFPSGRLRIVLMDDSHVEFRWAFALIDEARHSIGVFTEHCGFHVFPVHGAEVSRDGVVEYEHEARKRDRMNWPEDRA